MTDISYFMKSGLIFFVYKEINITKLSLHFLLNQNVLLHLCCIYVLFLLYFVPLFLSVLFSYCFGIAYFTWLTTILVFIVFL